MIPARVSCRSPALRLVQGSWLGEEVRGGRQALRVRTGSGWSGRSGGRPAGCGEEVQPFVLAVPALRQVQGEVAATEATRRRLPRPPSPVRESLRQWRPRGRDCSGKRVTAVQARPTTRAGDLRVSCN